MRPRSYTYVHSHSLPTHIRSVCASLGLALALLFSGACRTAPAPSERDRATQSPAVAGQTQAAQDEGNGPAVFTPEQLQGDLDFLYENLQEAHFNLFAQTSKAEYDAHFKRLRDSLDRPLELPEVHRRFQRFMAEGRIGHSRIDSSSTAFADYRAQGGKAASFYFRVIDGRVFVTEFYSTKSSNAPELRAGDEIVGMEGRPIALWLERLTASISAESKELAYGLLEFRFPELLWLEIGAVDSIELELATSPDGVGAGDEPKTRRLRVPTLSQEQIRAAAAAAPKRLELDWNGRSARMLDGGIAYLRPGPFYEPNSPGGYDPTAFRQFIDGSFEDFLAAGAEALIIDLRDNPGGDNSFSDLMVAWLAERTFRFCSSFRIKVSPQTTASHARRMELNPDLAAKSPFTRLYAENGPGSIVEFDIPYAEPRDGERFEGEVFALINRHSYSNAVTVAALIQDYELGMILGEKTTDVASSYGAMEQFTLPETGLVVGYPKAYLVRPNGDGRLLGVTPDQTIETPLVEGPEDPVLLEAIALIKGKISS